MQDSNATINDIIRLACWLASIRDRLARGLGPFVSDADSTGEHEATRLGLRPGLRHEERIESLNVLLRELHVLARAMDYEQDLWAGLICYVPTPLPIEIARDLAQRTLCVQELGHSRQDEEIWWMVADQVPEAVLNLACSRYRSSACTPDRVEEVTNAFPRWIEIAEALIREEPPDDTKAAWLAARLRENGQAQLVERRRQAANPQFLQVWDRC